MAVVALREWDEIIRSRYFDCGQHQCKKEWLIPAGPGDLAYAKEIGYAPHRLDRCPNKAIWKGTRALFVNPIFRAALRSKDTLICGRGVVQEPVSLGEMVGIARGELDAFNMILQHRRDAKKS